MYEYNSSFFDGTDRAAFLSAESVIRPLSEVLKIGSVLDLGCSRGAWLSCWRERTGAEIFGVDGPFVNQSHLHIPADSFLSYDLSLPLSLGRRFDLVESLEVAEHLPRAAAETFVDSLTAHGSLILFSAAVPGQGGEYHVNERPWEYWRKLFADRGYHIYDFVRPKVLTDSNVFFWYRHNTFLFAHESIVDQLPEAIRETEVPSSVALRSYLPFWAVAMTVVIRMLPLSAVNGLSRLKQSMLRHLDAVFR